MTSPSSPNRAERLRRAIQRRKAAAPAKPPELPSRPTDEPARLGAMQRSLWLAHRLHPGSPAYNLVSAYRLHGALDCEALEAAFRRVVARHRLLRSTYRVEHGEVRQIVHPRPAVALERVDAKPGTGLETARAEAQKPFALEGENPSAGSLIRMVLVEEGGERFLLLVLHHIVADERSLELLWKEIDGILEGAPEAAPEGNSPAVQYDDFAAWERQRLAENREQELDFWRRRLDPPPVPPTLPGAASPGTLPAVGETAALPGRLMRRALPAEVPASVRRAAAAVGATPFAVYAFVFRLLLHRYAGGLSRGGVVEKGRPPAFTTPVSTRSHPATAGMIGYFLNPLPVLTGLDESAPVESALSAFAEALRELLAHAALPFQDVLEGLASGPAAAISADRFRVMFVHQTLGSPPRLGGARPEPLILDLGAAKFDLSFFVSEGGKSEGESSAELAVEYRTDRFENVWMERLLGHVETLLTELPVDLDRAVAELPLLTEGERRQLEAQACGAELDPQLGALLPQRILEQAHRNPEAPALIGGGVRRSYGEMMRAAESLAHRLVAAGVEPGTGERVAIFLPRSPAMIVAVLACHRAGAAYVPLDPAYPAERTRQVLEDARVAAVISNAGAAEKLPAGPWALVEVAVEADVEVEADESPEPLAETSFEEELPPQAPAYLLYTSGSTGRPKGVVVSHGNLLASTVARFQVYDRSPQRFLLIPSLAFDSSVAGLFWTLAAGGALVLPTDDEVLDPPRLGRLIEDERVTALLCVPSLYQQLLAAGSERLRSLEMAIVAGENCPRSLVEEHRRRLPKTRLYNEYGPTEGTVWATVHEFTRELTREAASEAVGETQAGPVSIGTPIPGLRVDVLDTRRRPLPAGLPGQAWISGPTVAHGYWLRPALTAEAFAVLEPPSLGEEAGPRRAYATGDQMLRTADGQLLFLGRIDEQIKLRGFRIEPGEVEAALRELEGVWEAAVVLSKDATGAAGDDRLVAFLAASEGGNREIEWSRELRRHLPTHMVPARLVALAELPRLPNEKIDRRRLGEMARDLEQEPRSGQKAGVARWGSTIPSPREQALVSLWEGLLGRSDIGLHDNFFELGGHSLLVVEMTLALERDFGVAVASTDLFAHPTVAELGRFLERAEGQVQRQGGQTAAPPYEHLFPLQPSGGGEPFVMAIPHFFSRLLAARFRGERPVYGLRGVGLRPEGNRGRWRTMEELGKDLVREIRRRFPDQPVILGGYSFGASMAFEAARILEEQGSPARRLYLIAPMALDTFRRGPLRLQLDGLQQPVLELSTTEALKLWGRTHHPFARPLYAGLKRHLLVRPGRRLLCRWGDLRHLAGRPRTHSILHADVRLERFRLHAGYRPGTIRTPTVFFNPQQSVEHAAPTDLPQTDAAATWRGHFGGPLEVVPIPDPHWGDAAAEDARRIIRHRLDELEEISR
ncbi:MAG: amino acid adenylation domain-containing protein [Acidobacteriota bacterium]|nr:amino acid adenylation domain-containing protein [Acidobacteriota bacterium]